VFIRGGGSRADVCRWWKNVVVRWWNIIDPSRVGIATGAAVRRVWADGARPCVPRSVRTNDHDSHCLTRSAPLTSARATIVPLTCYTPFTQSSKHQATIKQMYSKYECMNNVCSNCLMFAWRFFDVCSMFARCLLDVCLMLAPSCKRGISFTCSQSDVTEMNLHLGFILRLHDEVNMKHTWSIHQAGLMEPNIKQT